MHAGQARASYGLRRRQKSCMEIQIPVDDVVVDIVGRPRSRGCNASTVNVVTIHSIIGTARNRCL